MAKAERIDAVVGTKVVELIESRVVLELTDDEAETLTSILAKVGGNPRTSPRQHVDTIIEALHGLNFRYDEAAEYRLLDGQLDFDPYK